MLDFGTPPRRVAGVDLVADAVDPWRFHLLPATPRVAAGPGGPELALLRFFADDGRLKGGHLALTVDVGHPPERIEEARRALAAELDDERVAIHPLAPVAADAELMFLGRTTDADGGLSGLVRTGLGRVPARLDPPHRARFAVGLDPDGVRLVEAGLASGGTPVGAVVRLTVEGLWPALRVVARVDWERVYDHFSAHARRGAVLFVDDVQRLTERLVEEHAVEIHVVQGLAGDEGRQQADPTAALAFVQRELVERFCEPLLPSSREPARTSLGGLGEFLGAGSAWAVKARTEIERRSADIDLGRTAVIARTLTAQAFLADLAGGAPLDGLISDAAPDHPFFARFRLRVDAARPLAETFLDEVVLHLRYGAFAASERLDAAHPEAVFESWADASPDGSWTVLPEARFAAGAPVAANGTAHLAPAAGSSRELTLDLEALLRLRPLRLLAPADERVLATRVRVAHLRGAARLADHELLLAAGEPEATVWFHDFREGDRLEAAVAWLTREGRIVEGGALPVDTRVFRLPPPLPGAMTVQVASDDDWSDLERVTVALQASETGPVGTRTFDGPNQLAAVALELADPAVRAYRYRLARTWSDGRVEEDAWVTTDRSVLVVGREPADRLVVDLVPLGPELPQAGILAIEVELSYVDVEHQVRDQATLVIRARADRPRWRVVVADPNRKSYEYRVTVHRASGERQVGPWTASAARLLPIPVTPA